MANKMTKRDYFAILRDTFPTDHPQYDAVIAFIDHEVELLTKKNAKSGELTKKQAENKVFQAAIYAGMEDNTLYTITQIQKDVVPQFELSNQKLTHLLTPMVEEGLVVRKEVKRRAYYEKVTLAEEEGV